MNATFLRRILLFVFWPITDFVIAALANFFLIKFGTLEAVLLIILIGTTFNILFLYLLHFEKTLEGWIEKHAKKIAFARYQKVSNKVGETTAILFAYIMSGPAMVGAPLIWLFGIPKKKGYLLAFIGVCLNTVIWVGGVYNLLWTILRNVLS